MIQLLEEKPLSSLKKLRSDRDNFFSFMMLIKNIFQVGSKYKGKSISVIIVQIDKFKTNVHRSNIHLKKIIEVNKK